MDRILKEQRQEETQKNKIGTHLLALLTATLLKVKSVHLQNVNTTSREESLRERDLEPNSKDQLSKIKFKFHYFKNCITLDAGFAKSVYHFGVKLLIFQALLSSLFACNLFFKLLLLTPPTLIFIKV